MFGMVICPVVRRPTTTFPNTLIKDDVPNTVVTGAYKLRGQSVHISPLCWVVGNVHSRDHAGAVWVVLTLNGSVSRVAYSSIAGGTPIGRKLVNLIAECY